MYRLQYLRDSEEVDLCLTGSVEGEDSGIIYSPATTGAHVGARLMHLVFAIEAGVRVVLYWEDGEGNHLPILPLEGRGTLDFSKYNGLQNPRRARWTGAIGFAATSEGVEARNFTIMMELSKQRN